MNSSAELSSAQLEEKVLTTWHLLLDALCVSSATKTWLKKDFEEKKKCKASNLALCDNAREQDRHTHVISRHVADKDF